MDYSYIFRSAKIKKDSLEAVGFATIDGATDFEKLCELTQKSYELVEKKRLSII